MILKVKEYLQSKEYQFIPLIGGIDSDITRAKRIRDGKEFTLLFETIQSDSWNDGDKDIKRDIYILTFMKDMIHVKLCAHIYTIDYEKVDVITISENTSIVEINILP